MCFIHLHIRLTISNSILWYIIFYDYISAAVFWARKKIVCTWLQQVIQAQKIIILFFYLAKARPCLSKWMKRWSIFLLWIDYERMSVFVFVRVEENKKSLAATTIDKNIDVPMDISHFNPVFNNKNSLLF